MDQIVLNFVVVAVRNAYVALWGSSVEYSPWLRERTCWIRSVSQLDSSRLPFLASFPSNLFRSSSFLHVPFVLCGSRHAYTTLSGHLLWSTSSRTPDNEATGFQGDARGSGALGSETEGRSNTLPEAEVHISACAFNQSMMVRYCGY